jgi:hypothetical protein
MLHTSDDRVSARAIISKPASTFRIFFTFKIAVSRLETVKATPAASSPPSFDAGCWPVREYCNLVLSRSAHVLRNFRTILVGGFKSSSSCEMIETSVVIEEQDPHLRGSPKIIPGQGLFWNRDAPIDLSNS